MSIIEQRTVKRYFFGGKGYARKSDIYKLLAKKHLAAEIEAEVDMLHENTALLHGRKFYELEPGEFEYEKVKHLIYLDRFPHKARCAEAVYSYCSSYSSTNKSGLESFCNGARWDEIKRRAKELAEADERGELRIGQYGQVLRSGEADKPSDGLAVGIPVGPD